MKPRSILDTANIPNNGGILQLAQNGDEFSIHLKGARGELMNSRMHSSEDALAELGCKHISSTDTANVLVGGLGMGFTLAAALKTVSAGSQVTVAELVPEVVKWNQGPLGHCAGMPISDSRTSVYIGDVADCFEVKEPVYDSVLLDVDNGPEAFTHSANNNLYSRTSLNAIRQSIRVGGMLAVWSAWNDPKFTTLLKKARFKVETKTVRAHQGKGSRHTIYLGRKTVI